MERKGPRKRKKRDPRTEVRRVVVDPVNEPDDTRMNPKPDSVLTF